MRLFKYQDTATFVKVTSGVYANSKTVVEQEGVPVVFLQSTGFNRSRFSETIDADAICYPDPLSEFVVDNFNRLEGMYILAPLFGVDNDDGWYKVETVIVNRDHLLTNTIDNIELRLKKTKKIDGVS